jgi:hypothetical protein
MTTQFSILVSNTGVQTRIVLQFSHTDGPNANAALIIENPLPYMPELLLHMPALPPVPRTLLNAAIVAYGRYTPRVTPLLHTLVHNAYRQDTYILSAIEGVLRERMVPAPSNDPHTMDAHAALVHAADFLGATISRPAISLMLAALQRRGAIADTADRFTTADPPRPPL